MAECKGDHDGPCSAVEINYRGTKHGRNELSFVADGAKLTVEWERGPEARRNAEGLISQLPRLVFEAVAAGEGKQMADEAEDFLKGQANG